MNQPRDPNLTNLDNDVGTRCAEADIRISKTGKSYKLDVDETHEASKRGAMVCSDPGYQQRFDARMKRIKHATEKGKLPRTMIGCYAIDYVSRRLSCNSDLRGKTLTQLMNMEKENPDQDGVESDDNEDEIGEANTSNDTNTNT